VTSISALIGTGGNSGQCGVQCHSVGEIESVETENLSTPVPESRQNRDHLEKTKCEEGNLPVPVIE